MPERSGALFGTPQTDQHDELARLLSSALHNQLPRMQEWMATIGYDNFRIVQDRGRVVAGLGLIDMGQWFGGQRVPMTGVTAVGVAPDQRGSGVGSLMMRQMLVDLHTQGVALSALYPATLTFYRRFGYQRAGQRLTYELPLDAIDVRERDGELIPITAEHHAEVKRLYTERARRSAGNLDRPEWMWRYRLESEDQPFRFLVVCEGQPEGYVIFNQGSRTDPLQIYDVCALTPAAARRLLMLFAGYRSVLERMVWHSGPRDPFLYLLSENLTGGMQSRVTITRPFDWMLRIVDVRAALSQRGYPAGLDGQLHLDLRDPLLPENNGRFVLQVADGRGVVESGGDGRIALDVMDLAAIYSGFLAPVELQTIGSLRGPDADLALAAAVFSGPQPWIGDMF